MSHYLKADLRRMPLPLVRSIYQFGPASKSLGEVKLFLDDARNPPLNEKGWVVVRTVKDGIWFMREFGRNVTEVSLDNDLGPDPQGYKLLDWILRMIEHKPGCFPHLTTFTIHTGNLPKWRLMVRMLKGKGYNVRRRVPTERIYPRASSDSRSIKEYKA